MSTRRVVLDTNVLVSRVIWPASVPARAVQAAVESATVLISDVLVAEVAEVLSRLKFAAYMGSDDVRAFVHAIGGIAERVSLTAHVQACRDQDDDHVLALAVSGRADVIVTGDEDLLALHPFQGVEILSPRKFLAAIDR